MSRPTPKGFAELLQSVVHEPGTLSQAYRQFHAYSLGNQLLALFQCHEREIQPGPMATFPRWKELGRHVRKGVKAITLCMPITVKRKAETVDPDTGETGTEDTVWTQFIYKPRWFVLSQTEGQELPEPEIPAWTATRPLRRSTSGRFPSTTSTATPWDTRGSGRSLSIRSTRCRTRPGSTSWRMCCSATRPRASKRTRI